MLFHERRTVIELYATRLEAVQREHTLSVHVRNFGQIEFQSSILGQERFTDSAEFLNPRTNDAAFEFERDGMIGSSGLGNFQHKCNASKSECSSFVQSLVCWLARPPTA